MEKGNIVTHITQKELGIGEIKSIESSEYCKVEWIDPPKHVLWWFSVGVNPTLVPIKHLELFEAEIKINLNELDNTPLHHGRWHQPDPNHNHNHGGNHHSQRGYYQPRNSSGFKRFNPLEDVEVFYDEKIINDNLEFELQSVCDCICGRTVIKGREVNEEAKKKTVQCDCGIYYYI